MVFLYVRIFLAIRWQETNVAKKKDVEKEETVQRITGKLQVWYGRRTTLVCTSFLSSLPGLFSFARVAGVVPRTWAGSGRAGPPTLAGELVEGSREEEEEQEEEGREGRGGCWEGGGTTLPATVTARWAEPSNLTFGSSLAFGQTWHLGLTWHLVQVGPNWTFGSNLTFGPNLTFGSNLKFWPKCGSNLTFGSHFTFDINEIKIISFFLY